MTKGVIISQVMPFPYTPVTELSKEYLNAVKATQGMQANYSSMEGFVAAKVFTEVLQRMGRNPSREGFIDTLQGMSRLNLGVARSAWTNACVRRCCEAYRDRSKCVAQWQSVARWTGLPSGRELGL
jgi:hypothetical protein